MDILIAFLKLQGLMSGAPITFKGQHFINLLIEIGIVCLIIYVTIDQNDFIGNACLLYFLRRRPYSKVFAVFYKGTNLKNA